MSGTNVHDLSILIGRGRIGHITNRASAEEFERAHEFRWKLMETFALCAAHCIVVAGNHTVWSVGYSANTSSGALMSRIFITGAADGLGRMAAESMVGDGHSVVLHARNEQRAAEALAQVPGAQTAVFGDLSSILEIQHIAAQVNQLGAFDAVIHNAGVGYREPRRTATVDGLPVVFAVNTLAPYILTALINKPKRLVYLSSGLHRGADSSLEDLAWSNRPWNGSKAYSDSKLHDVILAFAVARKWPEVLSNALEPGWVATKMGGPGAPDDLVAGAKTQVWLATSDDPEAKVTGRYFYHQKLRASDRAASDEAIQERLIAECARISGVPFPA